MNAKQFDTINSNNIKQNTRRNLLKVVIWASVFACIQRLTMDSAAAAAAAET